MITNKAILEMLKVYAGTNVPLNINYLAIGDNNTVATPLDEHLYNEIYRKAITSATLDEVNNVVAVTTFVDRLEANFTWKEVGLYAGGTSTKDSGTLVARAVVNEEKSDKRTANVVWTISINRS